MQLFANTGVNIIANLGSGTPYTASVIPTPITGEISPSTEGSINGSRLPWQFNMDMNQDKNWSITKGEGADAHSYNVNVYFWIPTCSTRATSTRFTASPAFQTTMATSLLRSITAHQLTKRPQRIPQYYGMYVDNLQLGCAAHDSLGCEV